MSFVLFFCLINAGIISMREATESHKSFQNAQQTPVASRETFLLAMRVAYWIILVA